MKNQRSQILTVTFATALWQTLVVVLIACATAAMALIGKELIAGTSDAPHLGALFAQKHQLYFNWDDHTSDLLTFLTTVAGSLVAIFVWMKSLKDVHKDHTEKLWRLAEAIQIAAALALTLNISAILHFLLDFQPANTPRLALLAFFFLAILTLTAETCSTIRIPLATQQKNYTRAISHLNLEAAALRNARHPRHAPILKRWAETRGRGRAVVLIAYLGCWMLAATALLLMIIAVVRTTERSSAPFITTAALAIVGILVIAWLEFIRFNVNRRGGIPVLMALFLLPALYTYVLVGQEDGWLAATAAFTLLVAILAVFSRAPRIGGHSNMQVMRAHTVAHKLAVAQRRLALLEPPSSE